MENANSSVERIDIMLSREFKNIVKKDDKVATVFSIFIEHYSKARNRNLDFAST